MCNTGTVPGMNFGFRLPGPFRVGVSSKGRINVGVTAGPFSVSHTLAARPGIILPVTLDQFVAQAQAEGYDVQVTPGTGATIERGWQAAVATVVPGRGLVLKRTWSTWQILTTIGVILLVVAVCCGPAMWETLSSRD